MRNASVRGLTEWRVDTAFFGSAGGAIAC